MTENERLYFFWLTIIAAIVFGYIIFGS